MTAPPLTCELVDRDDIDQRYLAGTLPPDQAEAFEEHYFGCARCWALVQQGLALRAAKPNPVAMRPRRWWKGLAAASALIVSAAMWYSWRANAPRGDDAMRGAGAPLDASAAVRGDSVYVTWHPVTLAADYRVRVSAPDGVALLEQEVSDTILRVSRSALPATATDTLYVSVLARDALRRPVARSALTPFALGRR